EVAASAANGPKQICVRLVAGLHLPAVHGHQLCRQKVVARSSKLPHQFSFSSAERQACKSYGGTSSGCCGQPESVRSRVQIAHQRSCFCTRYALSCVNSDTVQPGKVEHNAALAHPMS